MLNQECDHLLLPINANTGMRPCLNCGETVEAKGTFTIGEFSGSLRRYPAGIFSQWQEDRIKKYIGVKQGDILLHNWNSPGVIYLFKKNVAISVNDENAELLVNSVV